jgi:hypothetical protein
MWPFKPKPAPTALLERLETLERGQRSLRLEWEDTLEKLTRIIGRINKRAALERVAAQAAAEGPSEAPGSPEAADPASAAVLAFRSSGRHR